MISSKKKKTPPTAVRIENSTLPNTIPTAKLACIRQHTNNILPYFSGTLLKVWIVMNNLIHEAQVIDPTSNLKSGFK